MEGFVVNTTAKKVTWLGKPGHLTTHHMSINPKGLRLHIMEWSYSTDKFTVSLVTGDERRGGLRKFYSEDAHFKGLGDAISGAFKEAQDVLMECDSGLDQLAKGL